MAAASVLFATVPKVNRDIAVGETGMTRLAALLLQMQSGRPVSGMAINASSGQSETNQQRQHHLRHLQLLRHQLSILLEMRVGKCVRRT